ncbi:hypothetical protein PCE1_003444 [Barthelona sp. PCE]
MPKNRTRFGNTRAKHPNPKFKRSSGLYTSVALQQELLSKVDLSLHTVRSKKPKKHVRKSKDLVNRRNSETIVFDENDVDFRPGVHMTMAEQLGLTENVAKISDPEWLDILSASKQGGFMEECCPICFESFNTPDCVVLPCKHVIHKTCLASLEKFTSTPICPLCRNRYTEVMESQEPFQLLRNKAATLIQACFRSYTTRKNLRTLGQLPTVRDQRRMRYLAETMLRQFSRSLARVSVVTNANTNAIIKQSKDAITDANDAVRRAREAVFELKQKREGELDNEQITVYKSDMCPICQQDIDTEDEKRCVCVTTCGHLFHEACLGSFETITGSYSCPVCRSIYSRRRFQNELAGLD